MTSRAIFPVRFAVLAAAALLAVSLLTGPAVAQTPPAGPSVEQVIAGYLDAVGHERLRQVDTLVIRGTYTFNGVDGPFTLYRKRPGLYRLDVELEGREGATGYDGTTAWGPARGGGFRALEGDDAQTLVDDEGDFDGPLVDAETKGHRVELVGEADVDGTAAHHLRVHFAGGERTQDWYLAKDTHLPIRKVTEASHRRAGEYDRTWYLLDYQTYDGVRLPSYLEREDRQHVRAFTVESVTLGEPLDDALFRMPASAASSGG